MIKKPGMSATPEGCKDYQRKYYQAHKEHAKEYQKQYHLCHKKSGPSDRRKRGLHNIKFEREQIRTCYTFSDIMHSPVEKTLKILEKTLTGQAAITG